MDRDYYFVLLDDDLRDLLVRAQDGESVDGLLVEQYANAHICQVEDDTCTHPGSGLGTVITVKVG